MTESLPRDDVRTHVITDALRRFGRRVVLVAVVVGALVGAYAFFGPHTYKSSATVLLRPLTGNALSTQTSTGSQSSTVAMETEASLVTSISVTKRVNQALGTNLRASDRSVSATVPPNSQIVQITYTAGTARDAQRRAQAFARAFLDYRSDLASQSIKAQLDRLNARADTVQQQLTQAIKDRNSKTPSADADTRVRLFTSNLGTLQSEIGQVRASSTEPGNVVTPAALPGSATGLDPVLLTVGGFVAGLILAFAVAIWRVRTDDRIRAAGEVDVYGVPVLAVLPDTPANSESAKDRGAVLARAEALRRTRTNLLAVSPVDSVIAVGGLTATEHSLDTAADLARALAGAGYRVILVDAAAAAETRPSWFPSGTGLSDLLATDLPTELTLPTIDGLQVLTAGTRPGSAAELYGGPRTRALLGRLRADADYVIVAIASADTAEATSLLLAANEVVFVATDGSSTHEQVAKATTDARRLGAVVLGLVVRTGGTRHRGAASTTAALPEPSEPVEPPAVERPAKRSGATKTEAVTETTRSTGGTKTAGRQGGNGRSRGRARDRDEVDTDEPPIWESNGNGAGTGRTESRSQGEWARRGIERGR